MLPRQTEPLPAISTRTLISQALSYYRRTVSPVIASCSRSLLLSSCAPLESFFPILHDTTPVCSRSSKTHCFSLALLPESSSAPFVHLVHVLELSSCDYRPYRLAPTSPESPARSTFERYGTVQTQARSRCNSSSASPLAGMTAMEISAPRRPWEQAHSVQKAPQPQDKLPSIAALTGAVPMHPAEKSPAILERDSGNWSMPQSARMFFFFV